MNISRNNYQAFFLDFHEGNLGQDEKHALLKFLDSNPDLREEFESYEPVSLQSHEVLFPKKNLLKKEDVHLLNYKTWLVAYTENDLDEPGKRKVEEFISQNPAYRQEVELLKRSRIIPEAHISFYRKGSLKKSISIFPVWSRIAAAACLLLGLFYFLFRSHEPVQEFTLSNTPAKVQPAPELKTRPQTNLTLSQKSSPVKSESRRNKSRAIKTDPASQGSMQLSQPETSLPISGQMHPLFPSQDDVASMQPEKAEEVQVVINKVPSNDLLEKDAKKFMALDDNDLAELGLKEQPSGGSSAFKTAVDGARNLLGINVSYKAEQRFAEQGFRETLAFGGVEFSRTVWR